jgi:hypothetical protein
MNNGYQDFTKMKDNQWRHANPSTLRELMIERIYSQITEETLQREFDTCREELTTMPDREFLAIYDELK